MEAKQNLKNGSTDSRFPLNLDCVIQLFKRLELEDCVNLAEAYEGLKSAADFIFKTKFKKVTFSFDKCIDIDRILYHVGPYVQSLQLELLDEFQYKKEDMKKIRESLIEAQSTCKELKSLKIMRSQQCRYPFCGVNNIAINKCFENYEGITSFFCDAPTLIYPQLLRRLPNLKRLGLHYDSRLTDLGFLTELNSLRSLTLHFHNVSVNNNSLLSELAIKNDLEELELYNMFVDEKTFDIIKLFRKLQLLTITSPQGRYMLSNEFPLQLKTLKLGGFRICQRQIVSLIEQRKHLGNVHLADCIMNTTRDFNSIANSIGQKVRNLDGRKVKMTLASSGDNSSKVNYW